MIFTLHLGFEARQRGCRVRATGAVTINDGQMTLYVAPI